MSDFIVSDLRSEPWFLLQYAVFKVPGLCSFELCPSDWLDQSSITRMASCYSSLIQRCFFIIGGHLLSHTVSSIVPSAVWVLTIVFGMGTGVTPRRIATKNFCYLSSCNMMLCYNYSESAPLLPHRANPHITIFLSQHPCKHACSLLIQKPLLHSVFDN